MRSAPIPIDINSINSTKDLLKLAEEVKATKIPRELKRENTTVAVIVPADDTAHTWKEIEATFGSWSDIDADAAIAALYRNRNAGSRPAERP
jgi:hypothetical protein